MRGIKQLSNGNFIVQYSSRHPITRMPKTLRRKTNDRGLPIKTRAEAERVLRQLVIEVTKALEVDVVPSWEVLVQKYLEHAKEKGHSQKTIENYFLCLKAHTFPIWKDRLSNQITSEEIRVLVKQTLSDRSESQKKNVLKYIRSVFTFAVDDGLLDRNPAPKLKFHKGDKIKNVLSEPQIKILLEKAKDFGSEWYPIWATALYTGMRSGELFALSWDKVDFEQRQIKVDESWNNKDGFKSTKSGDDRIVEIAPPLLVLLKELKLQSDDSVFVLPRLEKWKKGEQARELRAFLMGLGLPQVRFHDLRASWATLLLNRGIEPAKVMMMGGWKDLKTLMIYLRKAGIQIKGITDNLYLHNPESTPAAVIKLEDRRT
jgi:integrase